MSDIEQHRVNMIKAVMAVAAENIEIPAFTPQQRAEAWREIARQAEIKAWEIEEMLATKP